MDNTKRFSNRVEDYVKYRPHYPAAMIAWLQQQYGFLQGIVADIGAGTGIVTQLLLDAGYSVYAVEPNEEMLAKARSLLMGYPGFRAVQATAEQTTLPDASVEAIMAGQAFHWFDKEKCKPEWTRILNPGGLVVLVWNERKIDSPFEQAYDALINRHGKDYKQVQHRNIDRGAIEAFFAPAAVALKVFNNEQVFDFEGLKGRLLSSSYMPLQQDPGYNDMIANLTDLFNQYQQGGRITITYDTNVYAGRWL